MEIDGNVVCAKNHKPGVSCPDFQDRVIDIFHNYIYWSYLYSSGRTEEGKEFFERKFSKKLSAQDLALVNSRGEIKMIAEPRKLLECLTKLKFAILPNS